jgi:hypothetical protein
MKRSLAAGFADRTHRLALRDSRFGDRHMI